MIASSVMVAFYIRLGEMIDHLVVILWDTAIK